tara:strand:- start:60 stop:821 length:762 start_codon:yes stop_codon:yes gene_type:complete
MASNYCKYCNKYFHYKDLFDQHVITCEYFYRSRRQKDREIESFETLPSQQEQFKLIQHLLLKVKTLESEVSKLKISNGIKKRKHILDLLNHPDNTKPSITFEQWYKTFCVQKHHLLEIFNGDICDGIKSVLSDYLKLNNLPMCSFHQKANSIYIYTSQTDTLEHPKWIMLSNAVFETLCRHINHLFLQLFLQWQLENSQLIQSSDEERDKNISNVHKINGLSSNYEDKRKQQLKKWIYDTTCKDISYSEYIYI